jgi:hypothetical protein
MQITFMLIIYNILKYFSLLKQLVFSPNYNKHLIKIEHYDIKNKFIS